nr:hypothetical protein GBDKHNIE_00002 [uncultured bacterium]
MVVPDGTEFICTEHAGEDDSITVTWIGRNNFATAFYEVERDIELFEKWVKPHDKQHIVIGITLGSNETIGTNNYLTITSLNRRLAKRYGWRFIDMNSYLVNDGLADAGITPTAQDLTDIANGVIPTLLRSDAIYFLPVTYSLIGNKIFNTMKNLGWA